MLISFVIMRIALKIELKYRPKRTKLDALGHSMNNNKVFDDFEYHHFLWFCLLLLVPLVNVIMSLLFLGFALHRRHKSMGNDLDAEKILKKVFLIKR